MNLRIFRALKGLRRRPPGGLPIAGLSGPIHELNGPINGLATVGSTEAEHSTVADAQLDTIDHYSEIQA